MTGRDEAMTVREITQLRGTTIAVRPSSARVTRLMLASMPASFLLCVRPGSIANQVRADRVRPPASELQGHDQQNLSLPPRGGSPPPRGATKRRPLHQAFRRLAELFKRLLRRRTRGANQLAELIHMLNPRALPPGDPAPLVYRRRRRT